MRLKKNHFVSQLAASVVAVSLALGLAGCGGGGATDSLVQNAGQALYTTSSATLSMNVGDTQSFQVGGGGGGSKFTSYSVTSSDSSIAAVSMNGNSFTITGKAAGAVVVAVKDSAGAEVDIKVTVGATTSLTLLAPASVSTAVGASNSYTISGGAKPYTVVSSNVGVVSASVSADGNSVNLNSLAAGGAQIIVFDAKGASVNLNAVVTAPASPVVALYTTAPGYISLSTNGVIPVYQIGGGTPPYTVNVSAPDIISIGNSGNNFTVTGKSVGFGMVTIRDAVGGLASVSVSVVSGQVSIPFYTTAPGSVVINQSSSATYTIAGGTPPYTAVSSNQSVTGLNMQNGALTVTALNSGSANISLRDAVGATTSFSVTVPASPTSTSVALYSTAPSNVVLQTATTSTFNVAGGTGPYSANSSNPNVAVASLNGQVLSIKGIGVGTATVAISDTLGANISVNVSVTNPSTQVVALYTTAPSSIVAKVGSTYTYSVAGGTAPYTAVSSNTAVSTTSILGSTLTINGVAAGTANVVVTDATGKNLTIAVTAQ
ncbi:hypothetical protein [Undibacterium oligocarboniphilum]|uniref:BIG2 domain-containing protein n=1 Tax=Undibacterium oligocarboniphilum TaxID=666702 RepID=A0A850QRH0_9BURK|nr:hypothetical protein [Undibacterium oligocarboniphilum]MBC3871450.1 hypothetical protein [Undibacterium oligocarboniphilum]NVO78974.1 hypothetical protein [Undibacterium oligocarboniphilum]